MNVFSKSTIRAPLLYLFLMISISLISFGFVGKAVEFIIVQRETKRIEGYYRVIGAAVEKHEVSQAQRDEVIALLRADPDVELVDVYQYSSGVMQDLYNTDFFRGTDDSIFNENANFGVNNMEFWFLGTLLELEEVYDKNTSGENVFVGISLSLDADRLLAGYPDRFRTMGTYGVWIPYRVQPDADTVVAALREMEVGKRYLLRANTDPYFAYTVTEKDWINYNYAFPLRPLDGESKYYLEVPPGQDALLESPAYADIQKRMAVLRDNLHSLLLIGSEDMSALPAVQESQRQYYLTEGRWLNRADNEARNCGIVITQNLASTRKLALGDRITLTPRSIQDPYYGYMRAANMNQWQPLTGGNQQFEIVGIYTSNYLSRSYVYHDVTENNAYVPSSCLPAASIYAPDSQPFSYPHSRSSFVLKDPRARDAFTERLRAPLDELGFKLVYLDNNAQTFFASSDPVKASTSSGIAIFSIVLVLALVLAVYLYLRQQQRNFAIARGLGVPALQASRQLLLPLLVLGLFASVVGASASWNYALREAADSLSNMPTPAGVYPSATLSMVWLAGLWFLVFALLISFAWVGLRRLQSQGVLELLQHGAGRAKVEIRNDGIDEPAPVLSLGEGLTKLHLPTQPARESAKLDSRALIRFGQRQSARAMLKSLLALVLGMGFVLALGWLRANITSNELQIQRLFNDTEVVADVLSGLDPQDTTGTPPPDPAAMQHDNNPFSRKLVEELIASGYFKKVHTEHQLELSSIVSDATKSGYQKVYAHYIHFTDDLAITRNYCLRGAQITWLPGFDESLFTREWSKADLEAGPPPILMPRDMMDEHGLELGGTVTWMDVQGKKRTYLIAGSHVGDGCGTAMTIADPQTGARKDYGPYFGIYLPKSLLEANYGYQLDYSRVALYVDPAFYQDLERVKTEMAGLVKEPGVSKWPVYLKFWDEELNAALVPLVKNLALLKVLYPISVAVTVLLGAGLSLSLVLQQARESALLRALGVGVTPLRLLLSSTQLMLALAGVLLGMALLALLRGQAGLGSQAFVAAGLYLAGVLLGTLLGATLVSRRKPMDLLQVKE